MDEPSKTSTPKKHVDKLPLVLLSVAVLGAVGYSVWRKMNPPVNPNIIFVSGSIEADETVISPKVAGKLAKLFVDEGSDVKRGQLLATLDDSELEAQLQEARANLVSAQAKLDETMRGNRPEQIDQAAAQLASAESTYKGSQKNNRTAHENLQQVSDLQLQLDAARSKLAASQAAYRQSTESLRLVKAGTRPDQIAEAKAALDQAVVQLAHAETYYRRENTLALQGAVAVQLSDDAKTSRDADQKAVDQAKSHLADLEAGPRPEEVRGAQMQVLQAKADLDGATAALADAVESYRERLSARNQFDTANSSEGVALAQVEAARANLRLMRAGSRTEDIDAAKGARDEAAKAVQFATDMVGDTKLFAATDGVVKTKSALVGEALNPGSPVVTVADLDSIWIRVYVPEDQYGKLSLGQAVDVSVDSFPKRVFKGQILSINTDAEFTPKNAQTTEERVKLVFGVKIKVENPNRVLKPGMPGDATIHVH